MEGPSPGGENEDLYGGPGGRIPAFPLSRASIIPSILRKRSSVPMIINVPLKSATGPPFLNLMVGLAAIPFRSGIICEDSTAPITVQSFWKERETMTTDI